MKIIFFDYWTNGITNFTPLNKKLCEKGHDTMLFHIGSFKDSKTPREEFIEGILCRDISYYRTKYIYKVIKYIRPDVIVSLNTTYILDRTMVLACRNLGVKSVFLMHGDRPTTTDEIIMEINAVKISFVDKLKKAGKYFTRVIPNYLLSSWNYNKLIFLKLIPFRVLWITFKNPNRSNLFPPYSQEIIHNKCLVFANKYINYYQTLGYKTSQIVVTGNPKNDYLFNLLQNNFPIENIKDQAVKSLIESGKKYALFLEESLQYVGYAGFTYKYLFQETKEIAERLKKENLILVVKLHPSTDINKLPQENSDIIFSESDLEHLIYYSTFCIGHISSAVNLAILLNKPVLSTKWGKNKSLPDYCVKHKVAKNWVKISDKLDLNTDTVAREKYIENNITIIQPISSNIVVNEIIGELVIR